MSSDNFNAETWKTHTDAYRAATLRVTPILAKQAKNAPKTKEKK